MTGPPDLRWRLADDDGGQGALFEQEVERHIGTGEFRGTEFLHVNARRVINEVPKASHMAFRWTINAYRGCSHACSYCLVGETPVLMASGRARPIAELRPGDEVIGTERRGRYRRYTATPVLDHWSTMRWAYRITLEDGTAFVSSGDHRFLTERGWKHVTGSQQGAHRRPHFTTSDQLLGTGRFADGPKHGPDYERGYLCGMVRGDAHLGHHSYERRGRREVRHMFPVGSDRRRTTCPVPHVPRQGGGTHVCVPVRSCPGKPKGAARHPHAAATCRGCDRGTDRVAWRADGRVGSDLQWLSGAPRPVRRRVPPARVPISAGTCPTGRRLQRSTARWATETLRFILMVDPATSRKRDIIGRAMKSSGRRRIVFVEALDIELPMFDITTGTGDFVADGVVSHNCFARPTHEYLGMNLGEDFDRRIVVKVNAVERVRAELSPVRWAGDHIAMGTNTDPYQRCEGKYRLTQGIVGELAAARNPFSVLTKSTLILRDLDLLAEAARHTRVRANFSIGTLDDDVWRMSEPGTPRPQRRIEAVARLNEAGVPCGVLVAPVLPGISDAPEQLDAVVKACVEAGARSITPLLLHLRPGVREHYLEWLAGARPDLLERYRGLYPRAYAPKATQNELSATVAALVERHGGRSARPAQTRAVGPKPRRPVAKTAQQQLGL